MNLTKVILLISALAGSIYLYVMYITIKKQQRDSITVERLKKETMDFNKDNNTDENAEYFLYYLVSDFLLKKKAGIGWGKYVRIRYCSLIDDNKLENAKRKFAHFKSATEIPLVMIDNSFAKRGHSGIVITTKNIYCLLTYGKYENRFESLSFPWNEINEIQLIIKEDYSQLMINGVVIGNTIAFIRNNSLRQKEGEVFNELLQLIHKASNIIDDGKARHADYQGVGDIYYPHCQDTK